MKRRVPDRGDIWLTTLAPVHGREQDGLRPVLVVSHAEHFRLVGLAQVFPITQGGANQRDTGFFASLDGQGLRTQGVVMVHQGRAIDLNARGAKFIETVPPVIVDDVIERFLTIFE